MDFDSIVLLVVVGFSIGLFIYMRSRNSNIIKKFLGINSDKLTAICDEIDGSYRIIKDSNTIETIISDTDQKVESVDKAFNNVGYLTSQGFRQIVLEIINTKKNNQVIKEQLLYAHNKVKRRPVNLEFNDQKLVQLEYYSWLIDLNSKEYREEILRYAKVDLDGIADFLVEREFFVKDAGFLKRTKKATDSWFGYFVSLFDSRHFQLEDHKQRVILLGRYFGYSFTDPLPSSVKSNKPLIETKRNYQLLDDLRKKFDLK
ncbi:MAG: hypothetical protein HRT61_15655 [Ekhidna sp.]|nr:hypothetical protein [Ekhidna sp.]